MEVARHLLEDSQLPFNQLERLLRDRQRLLSTIVDPAYILRCRGACHGEGLRIWRASPNCRK